jgi:hypothetical protein
METNVVNAAKQLRYTLLLDGPTVETLEGLQADCGLANRAAVFDLAVVVLDWIVKQHQGGYEIGRSKGDNFQPMLLPIKVRAKTPAYPSVPAPPTPHTASAPEQLAA